MNYNRFKELWDALVPMPTQVSSVPSGMNNETMTALIEYGEGKKDKIIAVRNLLKNNT